jgi:hypothetical protein
MEMHRRALLAGAAAGVPAAARAAEDARSQVLGAWSLLEAVTLRPSGETMQWRFGAKGGLIVYSPSGMMSVQIWGDRETLPPGNDTYQLQETKRAALFSTYYGYCGRFEVDASRKQVRHLVLSSLDPSETGRTLTRSFALDGDRLTLTTPPNTSSGEPRVNRLTWLRS